MSTTVIEDQIRMYAKLLKIPTFTTYKEALKKHSVSFLLIPISVRSCFH